MLSPSLKLGLDHKGGVLLSTNIFETRVSCDI